MYPIPYFYDFDTKFENPIPVDEAQRLIADNLVEVIETAYPAREIPESYIILPDTEYRMRIDAHFEYDPCYILRKYSVEDRINLLKLELRDYDYIGVKIAMGVATASEYADQISRTEEIRKQIRKLEEQNGSNNST